MADQNVIQKQPKRGIYLLPNLFTVSALFAGFYAIVAAMRGAYDNAAIAIFVAMVMDSLDGRVARLTNTQSAFGAQLDSLADMVCFGIAPALIVYSWSLHALGKPGWLAAFVYAVATALRLARFNIQLGQQDKRFFQGLPCPAGAGIIASMLWVGNFYPPVPGFWLSILIGFITILTGLLMVSNIHYRSFKDVDLRGSVSFKTILLLAMTLVFIAINPSHVLLIAFFAYGLSGPMIALWRYRRRTKKKKS